MPIPRIEKPQPLAAGANGSGLRLLKRSARRPPAGLVLAIDVRVPVVVSHNEPRPGLFDRPRRREAARLVDHHRIPFYRRSIFFCALCPGVKTLEACAVKLGRLAADARGRRYAPDRQAAAADVSEGRV